MEDLIKKIKELDKLLTQVEKLLIKAISIVGWITILVNLLK